jgi:XTP/dITP diphosphohydrolase
MPSGFPPFPELVLATSNPGKLLEFRAILGDLSVVFRALAAFPEVQLPEEGDDYEANAVAKARAIAEGAGRPALADDSGIEVAALGGRPGPHSARFGGAHLDDAGRAALAFPGGEVITARGECPGRILDAPRGRSGFGYDPIFEVEGGGRSMAELPPSEKNRISHRARALLSLRDIIRQRVV